MIQCAKMVAGAAKTLRVFPDVCALQDFTVRSASSDSVRMLNSAKTEARVPGAHPGNRSANATRNSKDPDAKSTSAKATASTAALQRPRFPITAKFSASVIVHRRPRESDARKSLAHN